jgi:hypothetical protein
MRRANQSVKFVGTLLDLLIDLHLRYREIDESCSSVQAFFGRMRGHQKGIRMPDAIAAWLSCDVSARAMPLRRKRRRTAIAAISVTPPKGAEYNRALCCPGLMCVLEGDRAFCEGKPSEHNPRADSFWDGVDPNKIE